MNERVPAVHVTDDEHPGDSDALRAIAVLAAHAGARAILDVVEHDRVEVSAKSARHDLVTTADRAAEQAIIDVIRRHRPDDRIHAEESGLHQGGSGTLWLIDPLDGTANFVHHRSDYAVSIAALHEDGAGHEQADRAAVIHRPADGQWLAASGSGHDGTLALRTGAVAKRAADALVSVGFPHDPVKRPVALGLLGRLMPAVRDFRRIGSAACDLLAVATGTLDAYIGFSLAPWDYAAGHVLVRAAGGHAEVIDAGQGLVASIAASSRDLCEELADALTSGEDA
jgi:myo-inositol-1(or 4)-monophosphatase